MKNILLAFIFLISIATKAQEEKYSINNLNINNKYSNFGTSFYGKGKIVYASPKKKLYIIRNVWNQNQQPFLDLYIGDISEEGQLNNITKFSDHLNTRYHEADVVFTKNTKTVYFSRNNYLNKEFKKDSTGVNLIQLYRAQINKNGNWTNIEAMPFNSDQYQTGHPALSADEKTLYFISDMPGGFGKTDIYKASILEDGSIGTPANMGASINTAEKEMFPFISENNELYYSSNGKEEGFGELDVYVSKITEKGSSDSQNLGAPINSKYDDFAFIINKETKKGYFSSNRLEGKGDDDIYSFTQIVPIIFECNQRVKGIVKETETEELIPNALVTIYNEKGEIIEHVITDQFATFSFNTNCESTYKIVASKEQFNNDEITFTTLDINNYELELVLALPPVDFVTIRDQLMVNLNPIYFDLDKSNIRPDAAIELEKIVQIMQKYPELKIDLGTHTDSRAPDLYNLKLSERRAKSTINWIINKGINPSRIKAKGYGETKLVNNCSNNAKCSEAEHQLNRRSEFVIVNPEVIK